ncbi:hypothetical protein [Pengzhenrongella phosphoraccumulans]|uniref:hypothetical protein n=1 Tax=Pengzhenrongella phosphoraccumulans TaxID=3114394 RepID=UPI0038901764
MAISRRTLPSGTVSWRVKIFAAHHVIAEKSFNRFADARRIPPAAISATDIERVR